MTKAERKAEETKLAFEKYLGGVASKARMQAERQYDRRMPARAALVKSFVDAAINAAKANERERVAKIAAAMACANAKPAAPIRQQCVVVRRAPVPPPAPKPEVVVTSFGEKLPGRKVYVPARGLPSGFRTAVYERIAV